MKLIISIALIGLMIFACSGDNNSPSAPRTYAQGTISVFNESTIAIRLTDFTQRRGDQTFNSVLNLTVYPNQSRHLSNMLDGGETTIFPGGDRIEVKFRSSANDPSNPRQPLFENVANLVINGNNTILVKSGGDFGIGPE